MRRLRKTLWVGVLAKRRGQAVHWLCPNPLQAGTFVPSCGYISTVGDGLEGRRLRVQRWAELLCATCRSQLGFLIDRGQRKGLK